MWKGTNKYSEEELIDGCIAGKSKCQQELYNRYAKKMYVAAMRYSKTTHEADDILQEAFIKIFEHIVEFKKDCPLEYWIKKIVVNTALKQNRRKIDQAPREDLSDLNLHTEAEPAIDQLNFAELLGHIQKLSPGYQAVFNLYAIEGYKHKEIAEMLGITEGTSKSQYARAKQLLQEMILKEDPTYEKLREQF